MIVLKGRCVRVPRVEIEKGFLLMKKFDCVAK